MCLPLSERKVPEHECIIAISEKPYIIYLILF